MTVIRNLQKNIDKPHSNGITFIADAFRFTQIILLDFFFHFEMNRKMFDNQTRKNYNNIVGL